MQRRCALLLLSLFLAINPAHGYIVGPGPKLDEIVKQSDIIFKGTVVSTAPSDGKALKPAMGPQTEDTQFKVISTLKSTGTLDHVTLQHYGANTMSVMGPAPQHYHFEAGKTYLVCAKRTDVPGLYQQLWTYPTMTDDSFTACANDSPLTAKTYPEALLSELAGILHVTTGKDVLPLIDELDRLSGGNAPWLAESAFDRKEVMANIHQLMANPDSEVARAAIHVVGSASPYATDDETISWLNERGAVKITNVAIRDPQKKNTGGDLYRNEFLAVANSKADPATRALAIAALGQIADPAFAAPLQQWLIDPSPAVRRSATLLLADFPDLATHDQLEKLVSDIAPEVRIAVANAIGILQQPDKADLLVKLLDDRDVRVRNAAVISLVTFSPKDEKIAAIFRANVDRSEFAPIFFNAIAQDDPAAHLDGLAKVVAHSTEPDNKWIGEKPYLFAWEILLNYLQAQPLDQLKSGKFDAALDALGKVKYVAQEYDVGPKSGLYPHVSTTLVELESECNIYNICVPAINYAFFVQRGMTDRAKKYRLWALKTSPDIFTDNLNILFDRIDENPSLYARSSTDIPSPASRKPPPHVPLGSSPLFVPP